MRLTFSNIALATTLALIPAVQGLQAESGRIWDSFGKNTSQITPPGSKTNLTTTWNQTALESPHNANSTDALNGTVLQPPHLTNLTKSGNEKVPEASHAGNISAPSNSSSPKYPRPANVTSAWNSTSPKQSFLANATDPWSTKIPDLPIFANFRSSWDKAKLEFSLRGNTTGSWNQSSGASFRVAAAAVEPKGVFAHFMVGNVQTWTVDNWKADIALAQNARIDGFALNIALGELGNFDSIYNAFAAAGALGFKLIFSFDYAGGGPWPQDDVSLLLFGYANHAAYYRYKGKALVSTFEGWENAADWTLLKSFYGVFFMPDWSSRGASVAVTLANGVADGLFSWAAWPWGNTDMNTYVDASYDEFLKGKEYMMPTSPWFYTNMPGYDKNWLWRGDSLWYDRWDQVLTVQPQFVQIISWNDYGESHYIGPLHEESYKAFGPEFGNSPYNYVRSMPHNGWRWWLPFMISMYKTGNATVAQEGVVAWYRTTLTGSCDSGGTVGNTASQLLIEFEPLMVSQEKVFYAALLGSAATVNVVIGGVSLGGVFDKVPAGGVGVYRGSVLIGGRTGEVSVQIMRNGVSIATMVGNSILGTCTQSVQNWNAWVGAALNTNVINKKALSLDQQECIAGWGPGNFGGLCSFACTYGYCPLGACLCTARGVPNKKPTYVAVKGYPGPGMSASYSGLCDFTCSLSYCPAPACGTVKLPLTIPTVSPFLPPACIKGTGTGYAEGLCSYGCSFGFCPIKVCKCTQEGVLVPPPGTSGNAVDISPMDWEDHGLCKFACERGYCPTGACTADRYTIEPPSVPCTESGKYTTLDAIADAAPGLSRSCTPIYVAEVLRTMLMDALKRYQLILADNYDARFQLYAEQIVLSAPTMIREFYNKHGKEYFDCTVLIGEMCCGGCEIRTGYPAGTGPCRYCQGAVCYNPSGGVNLYAVEWVNHTQICPPDNSQRIPGHDETIYWNLRRPTEFWDAFTIETGLTEADAPVGAIKRDWSDGCYELPRCYNAGWDFGVPSLRGSYSKADVPNPKEIISSALDKVVDLPFDLYQTIQKLKAMTYDGFGDDVVDAVSVPILMIVDAVESMQGVIDIGEKIEDAKRKQFLMLFLSAILMLVPFVGGAISNIPRFFVLGRGVAIAGELGGVGLEIYDVVVNDNNSPLQIFGLIVGLGAFADVGRIKNAAQIRRGMDTVTVAKLGPKVATKLSTINRAIRACKK